MQALWREGTDFYEPVSQTILDQWQNFKSTALKSTIHQWVYYSPKDNMEIHGFCDPSEKAYAVRLYLRVQYQGGKVAKSS